MFAQFVQFETTLTEREVLKVAQERAPEFRAIPSLVQKFYLKSAKPNHYGGFYLWDSAEAIADYRQSELARTIPAAYRIAGTPDVGIHEILLPLRG
jgi:hypothetical protein